MKRKQRTVRRWALGLLLGFVLYVLLGFFLSPLVESQTAENVPVTLAAQSGESADERVQVIDDNQEALLWRLRLIHSAQEEICFTTFDYDDDESGQDMLAALLDAAERGVRVRMVVDGIRGLLNISTSDSFRALAAAEGVEVRLYNPVHIYNSWSWNYRMHDKYLIVDDTAYLLGGRNTNDLFLGSYAETYNIDRDLLVCEETESGDSSLSQLQSYFEAVWELDCCKPWPYGQSEKKSAAARSQLETRWAELKAAYPEITEEPDWGAETLPAENITLLSNPIEAHKKQPLLWESLNALWEGADDCVIVTPYIICDETLYAGLRELAENAESAEIITNATENGANPFGCVDYWNRKEEILSTGVGVYEAIPVQSLHTKTVLLDESLSLVGSYNLDLRSTYLDTELMLAVESEPLNQALRESAAQLMAQSKHVASDGTETLGEDYQAVTLSGGKKLLYAGLRVLVRPFRYLL